MIKRYLHDIQIAFESIISNKLKSILTALGIVFGVASVICMLAIGKGAQQEILEQIKMVGVNNIVITPALELKNQSEESGKRVQNKFSPGLNLKDVEAIRSIVPSVKRISPEIHIEDYILKEGRRAASKLIGVTTDYFEIYNLKLSDGNFFSEYQANHGLSVCIIGADVKLKFFGNSSPIGKYLKFGNEWLKVIGVLNGNSILNPSTKQKETDLKKMNLFIPVKTLLMRYENRAVVNTKKYLPNYISKGSIGNIPGITGNYNQLDKIIIQVKESEQLSSTSKLVSRLLLNRHYEVKDFEVIVPELLLKQQQRTKDIFNFVLGAIASISLLVGGIGIMNIMFASVMERIKEIGIRLAIGAKKKDIVVQFLAEAVMISFTGGIIGVILGIILSILIEHFTGILTIISPFSVLIAFTISAAVGIIFGHSPAKRAAMKDPIESLRYE